jgi:hypothetical protein
MQKATKKNARRTEQAYLADATNAFLSELRKDFVAGWKSFGLSANDTARLEFDVDRALGRLRKILSASPLLNKADFKSLCAGIRRAWAEQSQRVQSQIGAAISAEKVECEKIRKDIERIEADRQAFNSSPEVIEIRRKGEELNRQTAKLTNEIAHSRKLESMLTNLCDRKGIDPTLLTL